MRDYSFVSDYLMCKWSPEGNGPRDYNCYNLVREVYRNQLDKHLPEITVSALDLRKVIKSIKTEVQNSIWTPLEEPEDFCVVLFSQSIEPSHVGLWLDIKPKGRILHSCDVLQVTCLDMFAMEKYGFTGPKFFKLS